MANAQFNTAPTGWVGVAMVGLRNAADPQTMSGAAARAELLEMNRLDAMEAARRMALLRRVEDTEVAKNSGSTSTSSMLSKDFGGDQATCSRQVRAAKNLKVATLTEKALEAGEITFEKAEIIAKTMAELPTSLDELTRVRVEKRLIADATRLTLPDLRRRVLRVADIYAPKNDADIDENTKLRRQEAQAWQDTEFWMSQVKDGKVRFGGEMPALYGDLLRNQLGAIAAPRRAHLDGGFEGGSAATSTTEEGLTFNQRMGQAFCGWIERIPTDGLPTTGGTPATLTVNLDYDDLKAQLAAATLSTGTRISASEVRRLACNHGILPRVLDGKSVPLDQGRSKRLFTPAQRLAMADRDGGCTRPGCDRPPAWCEGHHINSWAKDGGLTNVNDGVLACAFDHHWAHANNIRIRIHDGHAEWRIDGIWQRNRRWRP